MQGKFEITAMKMGKANDERIVCNFQDINDNKRVIIDGSFKGKRNDVDVLDFTILHNHPLWDFLTPLDTYIFFNKKGRWEFCGRILMTKETADGTGIKKQITCESLEAMLNDFVTFDNNTKNIGSTPVDTITKYINNYYNAAQPDFKKIKRLSFDTPMYKYTDFVINLETGKKAVEALFTYCDRVNATINIRRFDPEIDAPGLASTDFVMNILHKENVVFKINQKIEIGVNMQETSSEVTLNEMCNVLKTIGADGRSKTLRDNASITKYGAIQKVIEKSDLTTQKEVDTYCSQYLELYKVPLISIACKPVDLSAVQLDLDSFKVGNIVQVINPIINVNEALYIEEFSYSLLSYYDCSITVANKQQNYLNEMLRI